MTNRMHIAACVAVLLFGSVFSFSCVDPREGYAPEQPIEFSHETHSGVNQIECEYCHVSVGESPNASIPGLDTCMNCHSQVQGQTPEQKREINKIQEAWKEGDPVEWKKVYDLPDHAQFNHQPHIMSGVGCTECHGQVNRMDVIATDNAFNMGWCVNCHRQPEHNASINCSTCHY